MSKKVFGFKKIGYAILLNLIICTLFISICGVHYDMADTEVFSLYTAKGTYTTFFTNYFLCAFCGIFQSLIYPLNAFAIVEVIFCFISFVMMSIVFVDRLGIGYSTLITVFISAFFGVNHYSTISFTLTPALLSAVGFLCLMHYIDRQKFLFGISIGLLLLFFASMYRFLVFAVSMAVIGIMYLVYKTIRYFASTNEKRNLLFLIRYIFNKRFTCILLVLIISTFSINFFSNYLNNRTEELSYYSQYTHLRSYVWDYRVPSYEEAKQEYDSVGISKNDLLMLEQMYMDDEGAFTVPQLEKMVKIRENKETENSLFGTLKQMIITESTDAIFAVTDKGMLLWAVCLISILYILMMKKKNYLILFSFIFVMFVLYLYLWTTGRCLYRGVYEIGLSGIIMLLFSIEKPEIRKWVINKKRQVGIIALILTLGVSIFALPNSIFCNLHSEPAENSKEYLEMRDYIIKNSDKKFEFTKESLVWKHDNFLNPLLIYTDETFDNAISFGGPYYKTPVWNREVKEFGTNNLYKNLINNNDVYLVDKDSVGYANAFKIYLNEHYSNNKNNINMKLCDKIGSYNIYSFYFVN